MPLYAWTDNSHADAEIYVRHQGEQSGLRYRFYVQNKETGRSSFTSILTLGTNSGDTELYGFQSALMESDFEGEYR